MDDITLASSEADAAAVRAVEQHHAELGGALSSSVEVLLAATARVDADAVSAARTSLVSWARRELVPHALAEEASMYPAAQARTEARLLIDGMLEEHKTILRLVDEVETAAEPVRAAAAAHTLGVVFDLHVDKENDLMLPLLASDPSVSVAELLGGMHDAIHEQADHGQAAQPTGGHSCGCGETEAPGYPELDARAVPHAIRHATVFGALDAVAPGGGLVLVAPHDPLPLLAQIEQRAPGKFAVDYLERGPEAWRLTFVREVAVT